MKVMSALTLSALFLAPACSELQLDYDDELDHVASESVVVGTTTGTTAIKMKTRRWEDHDGAALWPAGISAAVVVLYPAQRGWGGYLFAKKGAKVILVADFQGKPNSLPAFLGANMLEWAETELPGADLNHGILGSVKKKPPIVGPGDPPGQDPKVPHVGAARDLATTAIGGLAKSAGALRVEM
jgi:hypothetical protein